MMKNDFLQVDFAVQKRNDLERQLQLVCYEQRSCRRWLSAVDRDAISIYSQGREVEREVLDMRVSAQGGRNFLVYFSEDPLTNAVTAERKKARDDNDNDERAQASCGPTEFSFPRHEYPKSSAVNLKSLSYGYKELRRLNPSDGIEIATNVKANRPDGRRITQSKSHRVGVVRIELADINRPIAVAS